MSHIFISYSRKDFGLAGKIVQTLAENNLDTWIDWKSIPKGEDWEQEIYRGIEKADAFLFLISPDSVRSDMCNKEIVHAVQNGKRILPIFISTADVGETNNAFREEKSRVEISRRNYIFCHEGQDDFNKAIKEIQETIHTDYEWLKYQTELQVKALEWERHIDTSRLLRGKELREAEQQLANVSNEKDPQPTQLQREFILASRRNEERQRRQVVVGLSLGLVIMMVLSVFAFAQRNVAILQTNEKATALVNEEHARSTAQAEQKRADEQSEIALARQLAAQADLLIGQEPKKLPLAVLLSIESIKHANTAEGLDALRNGLALLPNLVKKFQIMPSSSFYGEQNVIKNPVTVLKFSPDGRWLGVGTEDAIISVWDTNAWKEVLHVEPATPGGYVGFVRSLSFSSDSNLLITGTDARFAQVWDIVSGKEISRFKHDDQIWIVGFTPDGKRAISGAGSEIVVWDPKTGTEFYRLKAGTNLLAISSNGKLAASAAGTDITVWNVETGEILTTKTQFTRRDQYNDLRSISALVFSLDGSMIASSEGETPGAWQTPRPPSIGGRIVVWDPLTGSDIATMQHGDSVPALAFSDDGKKLVSGSFDDTSRVWDVSTGRPLSDFSFTSNVGAVGFGKQDEWIVSSSYDGTVRIWDTRTGDEINRLTSENDTNIESIAMSPNGEFVAGGNGEGVWVWQIKGQEIAKMEHGQALTISSVDYSPDGKMLITASWDRKARTWNTKTGDLIATVEHEKQAFLSVFNPKGKFVASADLGGQVKIWNPLTGIEAFQIPRFREISQVLFSPDGNLLAISEGLYPRDGWQKYSFQIDQEPGVVSIWDVENGKEIARLNHDATVNSIAFSPDGKQILTAGKDGVARFWDIETQTIISKAEFNDFVSIVALSPDGQLAAGVESCSPTGLGTGSCTPKLRVWKPVTGEILWGANLDGRWISNLSFSPNSKLLVTENNYLKSCTQKECKNRVIVWNALNGVVINEKKYEYEFGLMVLAFNKDSTLLATGGGPSHNGWVDIWDPVSGTETSRIFYQQALSAVFSPTDNAIAIVGNQDGIAYAQTFSLDTSNLVDVACSRVKRNLTEQEWKDYLGDIQYKDTCPVAIQKNNDPNGPSYEPKISRDGQWIVFVSEASNLVCGNTNTSSDIFVYNRSKELIQKISNPSYGQYTNDKSSSPYISANGNYIVYESSADNLVAKDVNKNQDIFLYDRETGQTELISVNSKNEQANGYSQTPSVSDDGRFVVFESSATNLVPGDDNEKSDIFIRDRKIGETRMISISSNGSPANNDSSGIWISPSGEIINGYDKFSVSLQTIQGDGTFGEYELGEVAINNFETNTSEIISKNPQGIYANRDSVSPAISKDGRFVVFASEANNLVEDDTNLAWDIFLWDSQTRIIQRIIMGKDGIQPNGHSLSTDISVDGKYIVFSSTASNLIDQDSNAVRDVFIYNTQTKIIKRIEPTICSHEK